MIRLTDSQKEILYGRRCPYCGQPSSYIDSIQIYGISYGMVYACLPCQAWVGVHKDEPTKSKGRLANEEHRKAKKAAHDAFDALWKGGHIKKRSSAYWWLSKKLEIPKQFTHIGMFSIATCQKVIKLCEERLQQKPENANQSNSN